MIIWKWLLNSQFGLVNYLIEAAGLVDQPISWMGKDWIMAVADPRQRVAVLSRSW